LVTHTLIPTSLLHRAAANNEAPAVLSGLHNELECYIAEISAPSDVECGLTFWQDRHRQMSYPKLSHLALYLVAAPASQAYVETVFFRFAGTCAPENETGQVPTLSSIHFLE